VVSANNFAPLWMARQQGEPPRSDGALAQLVERDNGIVEVIGSIPIRSTLLLKPRANDFRPRTADLPGFCSLLDAYGTLLLANKPNSNRITKTATNRPNRNLAIPAAAPAIPVKPRSAATIAITKNINAHLNMKKGHTGMPLVP
jgi:hypothetical protein